MTEIINLEKNLGHKFSNGYKTFLKNNLVEFDYFEINGTGISLYGCQILLERNKTYKIQKFEPNYFLIGQDGDLGYFIKLNSDEETIYSLDLGALGSSEMALVAKSIMDFIYSF